MDSGFLGSTGFIKRSSNPKGVRSFSKIIDSQSILLLAIEERC